MTGWCANCDLPREPLRLIRWRNAALYGLFMIWPVRPHSWSDRVWWWLVPFAGAHAHSCFCASPIPTSTDILEEIGGI